MLVDGNLFEVAPSAAVTERASQLLGNENGGRSPISMLNSIVTRLFACGAVSAGMAVGIFMAKPVASPASATPVERPHYELAFNGDPQVCPKLKNLYNQLLKEAIRRDSRSRRSIDQYLTNFAVNDGTSFAKIGLRLPAGMENGPLDGVQFYKVSLDGEPRTIAVLDWYRGRSSRFTTIGILKSGIGPLPVTGGMGPMLPVPLKDIQIEISPGTRYLEKWPNFPRLLSSYQAYVQTWQHRPYPTHKVPLPPLPAIFGLEGPGLTIRPFQSAGGSLYFVFDEDLGLRQVHELSPTSGNGVVTLIQRFNHGALEDVCYLVLAPSELAATLERSNVR